MMEMESTSSTDRSVFFSVISGNNNGPFPVIMKAILSTQNHKDCAFTWFHFYSLLSDNIFIYLFIYFFLGYSSVALYSNVVQLHVYIWV